MTMARTAPIKPAPSPAYPVKLTKLTRFAAQRTKFGSLNVAAVANHALCRDPVRSAFSTHVR